MAVRRPTWRDVVFPVLVGIFAVATVMRRPRAVAFHTVDVLELIAAGVMFGFAIRAIAMLLQDRSG